MPVEPSLLRDFETLLDGVHDQLGVIRRDPIGRSIDLSTVFPGVQSAKRWVTIRLKSGWRDPEEPVRTEQAIVKVKLAQQLLTDLTESGGIDVDRLGKSLKTLLDDLPGNEPTDY